MTLLGGAAAVWPLAVNALQPRVSLLGCLTTAPGTLGIELQPALIARADRVVDGQFMASKCVAALLDC